MKKILLTPDEAAVRANRAARRRQEKARAQMLTELRKGMWPTNTTIFEASRNNKQEAFFLDLLRDGWHEHLANVAKQADAIWTDEVAADYEHELAERRKLATEVGNG